MLTGNPRNRGALALVMQAEIARGGAAAGLDAYERWLGGKRLDDGYALRGVATAVLRDVMKRPEDAAPYREAFDALIADGDPDAIAALARNASSPVETQIRATLGNDAAVKTLIAQIQDPNSTWYQPQAIAALGASHNKLAVAPLVKLLKDPDFRTQANAADALGVLGDPSAAPAIQPLLNEQQPALKFAAAQALLRLKDTSGLAYLREQEVDEHASVRVAALKATSVLADPSWGASVEGLLRDPDPLVRLNAADLAAPYYLDEVKQVVEPLLQDPNPGIRDEAARIYAQKVATDFKALRGMLRSADVLMKVRASARILTLTR